ncbi:hypothetical protein ACWGH1_26265 [Streptomyces sp. NPDC054883]
MEGDRFAVLQSPAQAALPARTPCRLRGEGSGSIREEIEQGVTTEQSEEFSEATGITVGVTTGVEAGGSFMGIGASASVESSVSTSIELGYTRRYGVQTCQAKRVAVTYDVPAGHAGALWSDTHEIVPIRGDGVLVGKESLMLHSGSYTGRTYPHTADVPPQVNPAPTSDQLQAAKNADVLPDELVKNLRELEAATFMPTTSR